MLQFEKFIIIIIYYNLSNVRVIKFYKKHVFLSCLKIDVKKRSKTNLIDNRPIRRV